MEKENGEILTRAILMYLFLSVAFSVLDSMNVSLEL